MKHVQVKCPVCKAWFQKEHPKDKYCCNECKDVARTENAARFNKERTDAIKLMKKGGCLFKFLEACHGRLVITMKESSTFHDVHDKDGMYSLTHQETCNVIVNFDSHVILCQHHFMIVKRFYEARPRATFDEAYLHVFDKETGNLEVD